MSSSSRPSHVDPLRTSARVLKAPAPMNGSDSTSHASSATACKSRGAPSTLQSNVSHLLQSKQKPTRLPTISLLRTNPSSATEWTSREKESIPVSTHNSPHLFPSVMDTDKGCKEKKVSVSDSSSSGNSGNRSLGSNLEGDRRGESSLENRQHANEAAALESYVRESRDSASLVFEHRITDVETRYRAFLESVPLPKKGAANASLHNGARGGLKDEEVKLTRPAVTGLKSHERCEERGTEVAADKMRSTEHVPCAAPSPKCDASPIHINTPHDASGTGADEQKELIDLYTPHDTHTAGITPSTFQSSTTPFSPSTSQGAHLSLTPMMFNAAVKRHLDYCLSSSAHPSSSRDAIQQQDQQEQPKPTFSVALSSAMHVGSNPSYLDAARTAAMQPTSVGVEDSAEKHYRKVLEYSPDSPVERERISYRSTSPSIHLTSLETSFAGSYESSDNDAATAEPLMASSSSPIPLAFTEDVCDSPNTHQQLREYTQREHSGPTRIERSLSEEWSSGHVRFSPSVAKSLSCREEEHASSMRVANADASGLNTSLTVSLSSSFSGSEAAMRAIRLASRSSGVSREEEEDLSRERGSEPRSASPERGVTECDMDKPETDYLAGVVSSGSTSFAADTEDTVSLELSPIPSPRECGTQEQYANIITPLKTHSMRNEYKAYWTDRSSSPPPQPPHAVNECAARRPNSEERESSGGVNGRRCRGVSRQADEEPISEHWEELLLFKEWETGKRGADSGMFEEACAAQAYSYNARAYVSHYSSPTSTSFRSVGTSPGAASRNRLAPSSPSARFVQWISKETDCYTGLFGESELEALAAVSDATTQIVLESFVTDVVLDAIVEQSRRIANGDK